MSEEPTPVFQDTVEATTGTVGTNTQDEHDANGNHDESSESTGETPDNGEGTAEAADPLPLGEAG